MRPVVIFHVATSSRLGERLRRLDIDAYALGADADLAPDAEAANLTDVNGDFAGLYGLKRDFVCLIRPDGHLGFIATPANLPELRDYLERLCDPADVQRAFG